MQCTSPPPFFAEKTSNMLSNKVLECPCKGFDFLVKFIGVTRFGRANPDALLIANIVRQFLTLVRYWLTLRRDPLVQRQGPGTLLRDGGRSPAQRAEYATDRQHSARALDDASRPEDMNLPGFRFHALVGRDRGRYAVNACGNWRITFGWTEGDAIDVDLEDYH
jgi:plasmid maintenance system killer protein